MKMKTKYENEIVTYIVPGYMIEFSTPKKYRSWTPAPFTVAATDKSYTLPLVQLTLQVDGMTLQRPYVCTRVGKVGLKVDGYADGAKDG